MVQQEEAHLVVQRLEEKFGETLRSMGLNQNDGLLEVFTSPATGTWTILVTKPDGSTCLPITYSTVKVASSLPPSASVSSFLPTLSAPRRIISS